jgi:glycosyltransferase involved in cell wall biosynthesis
MKLSIITCTYNSKKYLQQTIDSVTAQNISTEIYEHIFIDGNSTDTTATIIESYQKKYPEHNIKILIKDPK